MRFGTVIMLLFSAGFASGQTNLVPNPSFEYYTTCPTFVGDFSLVQNWFNPSDNSPDYYNECCTIPPPSGADVPYNVMGYQYARTGYGYASIASFAPADLAPDDPRDYIAVELIDSLIAGRTYCAEFYVNLPNVAGFAIKDMGLYFSVNNPYLSTLTVLPYSAQIVSNQIIKDTLNWTRVFGYYTAQGGEKFITIGNFSPAVSTTYITLPGTMPYAPFYYIDDVSVTECEKPKPELILPNVFTPNNDGHNDVLIFENLPEQSGLSVYNRWGNLMYSRSNYANDWRADDVSDGVYFYILKLPNGETKHGTLQIIR